MLAAALARLQRLTDLAQLAELSVDAQAGLLLGPRVAVVANEAVTEGLGRRCRPGAYCWRESVDQGQLIPNGHGQYRSGGPGCAWADASRREFTTTERIEHEQGLHLGGAAGSASLVGLVLLMTGCQTDQGNPSSVTAPQSVAPSNTPAGPTNIVATTVAAPTTSAYVAPPPAECERPDLSTRHKRPKRSPWRLTDAGSA